MGGKVSIVTLPGYMPMINNPTMTGIFRENAEQLVPANEIITHPDDLNRGGSTDMGDLSQIIPVIHPYTGAAVGAGHSTDYIVEDYVQAVINPAKAMAMAVIDLLAGGSAKAMEVLDGYSPVMTKDQYVNFQNSRLVEELYDGEK